MLKFLQYILYPPRFVKDMRAFRISEFSVFLLYLTGMLSLYYWYREVPMLQGEVLFGVLFCIFSYVLYVIYKVCRVPYLTLYLSISAIATIWSFIVEGIFMRLAELFTWEVSYNALLLASYTLWSLIYIVLFHAICHDMHSKRSDGMVTVRKV